jgi:DNA primase small subunit
MYKYKKEIPERFIVSESPLKEYSFVEEEIQLTFMYPRLDVNVSTTLNHLLKCPFSVHPKSKKLSIPFRA